MPPIPSVCFPWAPVRTERLPQARVRLRGLPPSGLPPLGLHGGLSVPSSHFAIFYLVLVVSRPSVCYHDHTVFPPFEVFYSFHRMSVRIMLRRNFLRRDLFSIVVLFFGGSRYEFIPESQRSVAAWIYIG